MGVAAPPTAGGVLRNATASSARKKPTRRCISLRIGPNLGPLDAKARCYAQMGRIGGAGVAEWTTKDRSIVGGSRRQGRGRTVHDLLETARHEAYRRHGRKPDEAFQVLAERQRVEELIQLVSMMRVELGVLGQHPEAVAR